jgi:hypothetical protein
MDDFVFWDDNKQRMKEACVLAEKFLCETLSLQLKRSPVLNRSGHGMSFLGAKVFPGHITLNRASRMRFCRKIRILERLHEQGRIDSGELQARATALIAFATAGPTRSWRWRSRVVSSLGVNDQGRELCEPGR